MDLHKHDRHPPNGGPPTDHLGKLTDDEVSAAFGRRMIGSRFSAVMKMFKEVRRWTRSRANAFRVERPSLGATQAAGTLVPLVWTTTIVEGLRLEDTTRAFIANRSGLHHVSALMAVELDVGTVGDPRIALLINGAWYSWLDLAVGIVGTWVLRGSDVVPLECGDRLELGFYFKGSGTLATLDWDTDTYQSYGYFGGHWECELPSAGCECVESGITANAAGVSDTIDTAFGTGGGGGG